MIKTNVRLSEHASLTHLRDRLRCPWAHRLGARYAGADSADVEAAVPALAQPVIRPLLSFEAGAYLAHLIRLDPESRRLRFARPIDNRSLRNFVAAIDWSRALVLAHIEDGAVRGAAHLAWPDIEWLGGDGELAAAVEQSWCRRGIGRRLLDRATGEARARGLAGIMFFTQADNQAMLALAGGFNAPLSYFGGDVEGRVALDVPPAARPLFFAGMSV
ncbi:MAG TPA: GNAT family N-acetyltransferase [Alphaproteobacteria bacterium]|nr:GNAT family N-acetyltransferase [Alphaproteobacteria bacterium]